ncbi:MAG: tetratricopeptide repeat protein [Verrucomicrobiota bacterium]|jgi:tetratricopeptide (TPR) repeat protein|nr:tetratricopeptide repeat protein [Verrucomicrobiota bacterium]
MAHIDSTKKKLSQREQRDLDIEIDFLEGVLKRDRRYVEALQLLGDDYTRRGRYEDGLRVDRRLARLCPDDPLVYYNLACSFSLTAEYRKAANALRKAIGHGYRDFDHLRCDADLAPLREQPIYATLKKEITQLEAEVD